MKSLFLFVSLIMLTVAVHAKKSAYPPLENLQNEKVQARCMLKKFNAYNKDKPNADAKMLRVVYFHAADREPCDGFQERIQRIMFDFQEYFKKEMARNGLGPKTIALETENGKLKIHVVKGKEKDGEYNYHSGGKINAELKPALKARGIDMDKEKVIIFNGLSKITDGTNVHLYAPYYGMGANQKYGICHVADCAVLDTVLITNVKDHVMMQEHTAPRRMSLAKFNTIYIGGALHELGHGLTLPHNFARNAKQEQLGTALMGAGNYTYKEELRGEGKGSFLTVAHAMRLLSQPVFSGSVKEIEKDPRCELEKIQIGHQDGKITIRGTVNTDVEPYAVIAYNDPEGSSDYNAKTWTAFVNDNNEFLVKVDELEPGTFNLRLTVCHLNGAVSTFPMHYTADSNSVPDIASLNLPWAIRDALTAYIGNKSARVKALAKKGLQAYKGQEQICDRLAHLERLCKSTGPFRRPDRASGDAVFLSDCTWESADVGWRQPKRDEYCREDPTDRRVFLEIGSKFYPKGLYAHSPSKYVFNLGKRWKTFTSDYGLQKGGDGKVVFVVKGDGKELFRSDVIGRSREQELNVDVSGVDTLELIVENGSDKNARCWSIWGAPKLSRGR
jgi:hypothetical protein